MSDSLADGRKLRLLTVIDLYTRESLAIRGGTRFTSGEVAEVPARVALGRGVPREVRVDNGPEFAGRMLDLWAYLHDVTLEFSRPGKPTDNAFLESFNGRVREGVPQPVLFHELGGRPGAGGVVAHRVHWMSPHSDLGYLAPGEFVASKVRHESAPSDRTALV